MQVAAVLSDLTSLRVCDPKAAMALVTAKPGEASTAQREPLTGNDESDADLKRAKDLLWLHAAVKVAHQDGTDKELNDARKAVEQVLSEL
ncbi:hypothetical protein LTR08_006540 [Meristemomyces frigidus]|nr:hypothetical protein LTR08_006540 [Meristemomyces frigidus]